MMNRYFTGRSSLSRRMPAAGLGLTAPSSFNIAVTESFVCSSARFKSSQFPGPHRNPSPGRNSDNNNGKRRRDLSSRHNNQRQGHHHHERKYSSSSKPQQQQARSERSNKSRQSEGKKEETTYVVVYRDGTFKTSKDWNEAKPWTIGQANKNKGFKNPTQEEIDSFIKRSVGLFRIEAKTPQHSTTAATSSSSINDEAASQMEMMMDEVAAEDHHQSQNREDIDGFTPDFSVGSGIETNLRGENSKKSTSSTDEKASFSKRDKRRETTSSAKKSEEYASDPLLGELDNLVEDLSSMNTSSPIDEQDETPNRRDKKTFVRTSSDTGEESTRASNNGKWKIVELSEEEEPMEAVASQIQETTRSSEALPSSSAPEQQESPMPTEKKHTQEAGKKTAGTQAEVQKKPSPKKDSAAAADKDKKHEEKTSRDDQRVGESKNKLRDDTGGSKTTEVKKDTRNEDSGMTKAEDVKDLPQARSAIEDTKVRVQKLRTAIEEETRDVEQLKQQQKDKLRPIHTRPTTVAKVPEGVTSSSSTLPLSRTESLENLQLFHPLTKEAASELMLLSPEKKDQDEDEERSSSLDPTVVSRVAHLAKLSLIGELIDLPSFGSEKKEDGEIISPEKKGIEQVRTIPSFVDLSVQMQEEVYKVRCEGLSLVNFCLSSLRPGDLLHIVGDLIVKGGEPTVQVKEAGGTLTLVYGPADEDPNVHESIESDKSESNDTSN